MRSPHERWRDALAVGAIALFFALLNLVSFVYLARTCTGRLVRIDLLSGSLPDSLPIVATSRLLSSSEDVIQPLVNDTQVGTRIYELGPFRLRSHYGTGYHSRPGAEKIILEDPSTCTSQTLPLFNGSSDSSGTLAAQSATLREGPGSGEWSVHLQGFYDEKAQVAFRRIPVALPWPSAASVLGTIFFLFGLGDLRRAARYFRRGGLATWTEGRLRGEGWIEAVDGGERVEPVWTGASLAAGDVLFLLSRDASPTYRTTGWPVTTQVRAGSHAALALLHARFARRAMILFAIACVAFVGALL